MPYMSLYVHVFLSLHYDTFHTILNTFVIFEKKKSYEAEVTCNMPSAARDIVVVVCG